jgi:CHAT domain-containing protein/tetratricopeptide (TPR) repeat protein
LRQALEIRERVLGPRDPETLGSLETLGQVYESMGSYAKAEPLFRRVVEIREDTAGTPKANLATSLDRLASVYRSMGDYARAEPLYRRALELRKQTVGEKDLAFATSLDNLAAVYEAQSEYAKAERLYRQALDVRREALGEKDPAYAQAVIRLATVRRLQGDYAGGDTLVHALLDVRKPEPGKEDLGDAAVLQSLGYMYMSTGPAFTVFKYVRTDDAARAEPFLRQALAIRKRLLGETHPTYADTLHVLAALYRMKGDYARAEPLFLRALEIRKVAPGEESYDYANTLNSLGVLYGQRGDYARAEAFRRRAAEAWKKTVGDRHPNYANSLDQLGNLYEDMGDLARAEPLLRQALEIDKEVLGTKHLRYAGALDDLAALYRKQGDYARAESLLQEAVGIQKQLGADHPSTIPALINLARLYLVMGKPDRAEAPARQALQVCEKALGESQPTFASALTVMGQVAQARGDPVRARDYLRRACELRKKLLGPSHPDYAESLKELAAVEAAADDAKQAEPLLREALAVSRGNLQLAAGIQSERQQLAMAEAHRDVLDRYLSLAPAAGLAHAEAYQHLLAWKGAVFTRQQHLRLLRTAADPETARLLTELRAVTSYLATLAFAIPDDKTQDDWKRQVRQLTEERERLEAAVAARSAAFRRQQAVTGQTPAQVQAALPKDAALVDFLEYTRFTPPAGGKGDLDRQRRLLAFVVRPDRVDELDLGPARPVAEAVDRWRTTFGRRRPGAGTDDPAAALRRSVWQPLEAHLAGARTVLVSPDGALARFPLAVLPGKEAGTYLLEERSLATVPVPQLLPELLARAPRASPKNGDDGDGPATSLLLLGDVDFDAAPAEAGTALVQTPARPRSGALQKWQPLPATRGEILAVRDSFEQRFPDAKVRMLRGKQATKSALEQLAPRYRWLHLATHGFFAPPQLRSALAPADTAARRPEVDAGQAVGGFDPGLLSGLALVGANRRAEPGREDGILTALEVAELDLRRVDLAVLSACETGLGEAAGGEGLLGLQRAFQMAGARTVVASLWQVDDKWTRALMERFYENLWQKGMGRLEALREAQLWVLREGPKRGLELLTGDEGSGGEAKRAPPYYWAAFVLSGDWR